MKQTRKHTRFIALSLLAACFLSACQTAVPTEPIPEPMPSAVEPGPIPEPLPVPIPEPVPTPIPEPEPDPVSEPEALPEHEPKPAPEPPLQAELPPESEQMTEPDPVPQNTLYVLMYHHFVEDADSCNDVTTTADCFREDLQWLGDNGYTFVLPRDLIGGASLPERAVMLTMDDGYASNYHQAFPLLQEYRASAAIALITHGIGRTGWAMTWEMCREMYESGLVEFGSHSHNTHHDGTSDTPLGIRSYPEETQDTYLLRITQDLQTSIDRIETNLQQQVLYFSYPNGAKEPWAEPLITAYFPVTATSKAGSADLSGGLWDLPRFNMNADSRPWDYLPPLK